MKTKAKLNAGLGLLFLMIIILSVLGGWYINQLKKDSGNILTDNYNTLEYARNMLLALEESGTDPQAFHSFEKQLSRQRENVTEVGEKDATDNVARHFQSLKQDPHNAALQSSIRKDITLLMQLNMSAIERKSGIADATARNAITMISIAGTLCFLIAFVLMVNLPGNIADPIRQLTESIRQIANQNYRERVHLETHSEFGTLARSFNTMAEKLQEYSESRLDKILKGKRRIETLIDNMHDPVIGIDEQGLVLFVNDEALKITGIKREQFAGKRIQDIAVSNDLVRDMIREIATPGAEAENKQPLKIYADGKESYFEKEIVDINIVPTGENGVQFIGQVIMLRNITPFKELDMAKTHFIGTVSHEFKTPIASIQMGLQLLENPQIGQLNEEQQNLVRGIKEDAGRLLNITAELLNIAQVESGAIQLQLRPAVVAQILDYALQANKSAAQQRAVKLHLAIASEVNRVLADSEKTAWVLNNLLSNAIRYSPENTEVFIDVKQSAGMILFRVKDQGPGIEKQYLDKVFDRYFRIPGVPKGGTGLGLSISKEFIELQGGTICVESEFGSGSTFSFTLLAVV